MTPLTLKKLSCPELKALYDTELSATFPRGELKPFFSMEALLERGQYHPYGAYDQGGTLLGYALLWSGQPGGYILLDYLGVVEARRNGGLGEEILRLLGEAFSAWKGILAESDAEIDGEASPMCERRLDFYRRAGFQLLDYDIWLFGVRYWNLALPLAAPLDPQEALESHSAIYHQQFTPEQRKACVRIPLLPGEQPVMDWQALARMF